MDYVVKFISLIVAIILFMVLGMYSDNVLYTSGEMFEKLGQKKTAMKCYEGVIVYYTNYLENAKIKLFQYDPVKYKHYGPKEQKKK